MQWRRIARANGITDPRNLSPGTTLVVPGETSDADGTRQTETGEAETGRPDGVDTYTVSRGETLWEVASAVYGDPTRWNRIASANDVADPRNLQPGTALVIPRTGSGDRDTSQRGTGDTEQSDSSRDESTYTVERGDTLWSIAREEYGDPTEWQRIAQENGITDPRDLQPGTTLDIPRRSEDEGDGGESADREETSTYTVEYGDTLWEVAESVYGDPTEWRRIAEANGIDSPRNLQVGTTLVIPGPKDEAGKSTDGSGEGPRDGGADDGSIHTVEAGETLWEIADDSYGDPTEWQRIAEANDVDNPRNLEPGTTLTIPPAKKADEGTADSSNDDSGDGTDGGTNTRTVEAGVTLWEIADDEYGDPNEWQRIAQENDISGSRNIQEGAALSIAAASDSDEESTDSSADTSEEGSDDSRRTHTVKHGETLWEIADDAYGDPTKWQLIAQENDISNPRDLQPGTTLTIPPS